MWADFQNLSLNLLQNYRAQSEPQWSPTPRQNLLYYQQALRGLVGRLDALDQGKADVAETIAGVEALIKQIDAELTLDRPEQ